MRQIRSIGMSLLMLMATTAWAANISGRWIGSLALAHSDQNLACAHLEQKGTVVTGSMGASDSNQFPLIRGRIVGDEVTMKARPGPAVLRLTMN